MHGLYNILKSSIIATSLVCSALSCQQKYELVPPPAPDENSDDRLEDEDFGGGQSDYFVTLEGSGEKDGTSWENAMDAEGLLSLLTDGNNLSEATIRIAEGTYLMNHTAAGVEIRKNIKAVIGGYSASSSGQETGKHDPELYPTVFSGDVNNNGTADEGDCGLIIVNGGSSRFESITFSHGYLAEKIAETEAAGSGIFVNSETAVLELADCMIKDCYSPVSDSDYAGGSAIRIRKGTVRLQDVDIFNNRSHNRGGAIRLRSAGNILMMDRCSVYGNSIDGDWGSGIQISDGVICMNNCSVFNNKAGNPKKGGQVNGGGAMLFVNTTVIGNDSNAGVRCESKPGSDTRFVNSIFLSEKEECIGFLLNGKDKEATSFGYNLYRSISGDDLQMHQTDTETSQQVSALGSIKDNIYAFDSSKIEFESFAALDGVLSAAKEFSPESVSRKVGEEFVSWCTEDGFSVDGLGNVRNPESMNPGAYDNHAVNNK